MVSLLEIYRNARETLYEFARSLTPSLPSPVGKGSHNTNTTTAVISSTSSSSSSNSAMEALRLELESILHHLKEIDNEKKLPTPGDYLPLRRRLGEIDSFYQQGRFLIPGMDDHIIPEGQGQLANLLHEAHTLLEEKLEKTDYYRVSPLLRTYHDRLLNIISAVKFTIESKANTPHSLHPSDLYHYRQKLAEIDEHYQQGRFFVKEENLEEEDLEEEQQQQYDDDTNEQQSKMVHPTIPMSIPEGQAIIAELFQEAYDLIHEGLFATDYYKIVDEHLVPLHDKLDDYIVNFTRILNTKSKQMMDPKSKKMMVSHLAKYERNLDQIHHALVNEYPKKAGKDFDQEGYNIVMDLYQHASHLCKGCKELLSDTLTTQESATHEEN